MDYPAAHSMDTTWFCVDDEGHVALMESAEPGAVPSTWSGGETGGDEVLELLPLLGLPVELSFLPPPVEPGALLGRQRRERVYERVLIHSRHPQLRELIPTALELHQDLHGTWLQVGGHTLLVSRLRELLGRGLIEALWSGVAPATPYGIYSYEYGGTYGHSMPYVPDGPQPTHPLHVEVLPEELQRLAVALPGARLSEGGPIQPAEHTTCYSWQERWVDLEGRVHRFRSG